MKRITSVEVQPNHKLRLRYDDGVEGVVDLSNDVGKGIFAPWKDPKFFATVKIERGGRALIWSDELDLCADALYLEITGKPPEDLFPALKHEPTHA
jgi:hypothetical protein